MKSIKPILEPRPPSIPKGGENDLNKAFASLEEDIINLQNYIERSKVKSLDSGVYRGKLNSRRSINNSNRHNATNLIENSHSLQQYRNSTLTEPVYNLILSTLGPSYSSIPTETILRLSLLKIKLHEIFLKKIGELVILKLCDYEIEADGKLLQLFYKLCEAGLEIKETVVEDKKSEDNNEEVEKLRLELRKEAKAKKECEDTLARYIINDRQKSSEIEALNKKIKEADENIKKIPSLMDLIEQLKKKNEISGIADNKLKTLQAEYDNLTVKFTENNEVIEKLNKEIKKLKENIEKSKTKEKLYQSNLDSLNQTLDELKTANSKMMNTKNNEQSLYKEFEEKIKLIEKTHSEKLLSIEKNHSDQLLLIEKSHSSQISLLEQSQTEKTENLASSYESKIKSYESKIDSLESKNMTLEQNIKSSEENFESIIKELKQANSQINSELLKTRNGYDKLFTESNQLKSSISIFKNELENSKDTIKALQKQIFDYESQISELNSSTKAEKLLGEAERFLNEIIKKLRTETTGLIAKIDEKELANERLESENKYLKSEIYKCRTLNEKLQDDLAKANQDYDEDTFENVMRHELTIMRDAYEKKIKEFRDEIDSIKKKNLTEVRKLKEDIKVVESAKEYLEIRIKALKNPS